MNNKGNIMFFFSFISVAFVLLLIFTVGTTLVISMNTSMYEAAEEILIDANTTIQSIADPTIKAEIQSANDTSLDSIQETIMTNELLFQYSWLIILFVIGLMFFIFSRTMVERQGGAVF